MKKLPKEKRNQVILVWLVTVAVIAGWAFVVLDAQLKSRQRAKESLTQSTTEFENMTNQLAQAEEFKQKAEEAVFKLDLIESKMATGDTFSWAVNTLRNFKQGRNVDIPQISQPTLTKNTLLPKFPYDQARLSVSGTGFYHDIGLFISDFENEFPNARINNLDIQPGASGDEKLIFRMDIIFLVKPDPTASRS